MNKKLFLLIAFIIAISFLSIQAQNFNLIGANRLNYGANPYTDSWLDFSRPPTTLRPIFSWPITSVSSRDCNNQATIVDDGVNYDCYNNTWTKSVNIEDTYSLLDYVTIIDDVQDDLMTLYGSRNEYIQNLYAQMAMRQQWKSNLLVHEFLEFWYPQFVFNQKFVDAISNLDPTPGARYFQFLDLYGLYYINDVAMGSIFSLEMNVADGEYFPPDLQENDFYAAFLSGNYNTSTIGGNPEQINDYGLYDGWTMSSTRRMGVTYAGFESISTLLSDDTFSGINDISVIQSNLEDTISDYLDNTGSLWLDQTVYQNGDPSEYMVSVVFSGGLVQSADGPARFFNDGNLIVDIAFTSKFISYLQINHSNSDEDLILGNILKSVKNAGYKDYLNDGLSPVIGLQIIDSFKNNGCKEIMYQINDGEWYDNCKINSFTGGITSF